MKIKKGDTVVITKGKDRGKSGKVSLVNPGNNKVVILGFNQVKKTVRPKKQGDKGQIISVARPIDISNVMIMCPSCGKPTRIGFDIAGDKKKRVCKKCKGAI
jgi:large subunit ribosomal protein L24